MDVSFFGEMAWKSALISGAALALAFALRSRAASDRALVLRLGVAMLLLLPFIALALPALRIEAWAAPEPAPLGVLAQPALQLALPADAGLQPAEPTIWDDPTPLVLLAYLGGLADGRLPAACRPDPARPLDPRRPRNRLPGMAARRSSAPAGPRPAAKGCGCWSRTRCPRP